MTDPTQDVLGSGRSNFDALYAGRAVEADGPSGAELSNALEIEITQ